MQIVGYLQTSLIEWPGKIASVVFVPGCNFRCPFCHNAGLVDNKRIAKLPRYQESEILADLKKRKQWVDGVVITGGEPLLQKDLVKFFQQLKKMGFKTMLETNGSITEALKDVLSGSKIDLVRMDYKVPFENYSEVVKVKDFNPKVIKKSIKLLLELKKPLELRTTVVPGIHNKVALIKMAKELQLITNRYSLFAPTWSWQNFRPKNCLDPEFNKKKAYLQKKLRNWLTLVKKIYPQTKVVAS